MIQTLVIDCTDLFRSFRERQTGKIPPGTSKSSGLHPMSNFKSTVYSLPPIKSRTLSLWTWGELYCNRYLSQQKKKTCKRSPRSSGWFLQWLTLEYDSQMQSLRKKKGIILKHSGQQRLVSHSSPIVREIEFATMNRWVMAVQWHSSNWRHGSATPDTATQFCFSFCETGQGIAPNTLPLAGVSCLFLHS